MKEICDNKVPLVKMSQDDPLNPSSKKKWPGGQRQKQHAGVQHDQGEGYQQSTTFNHEGEFSQKSVFSKNVSGWSPKPIQQKKYQVDSHNNNLRESNMIKEKVINNP